MSIKLNDRLKFVAEILDFEGINYEIVLTCFSARTFEYMINIATESGSVYLDSELYFISMDSADVCYLVVQEAREIFIDIDLPPYTHLRGDWSERHDGLFL